MACASKRTQKEVIAATVIVPGISAARVSEPQAKALEFLLDVMRFGTAANGLCTILTPRCKQILRRFNDIYKVYNENLACDMHSMNASMYRYMDYSSSGEPNTGVLGFASFLLEMIVPDLKFESQLAQAKYFKEYRVTGYFHILLERPDGTIVISEDLKKVYLVQGLSQSLADITRQNGSVTLPETANMTLVPYDGHIVHDGLLLAVLPSTLPCTKNLYRVYAEAANKGEIITSIPLPSAQEVAAMKLAASQKETTELSPYHRSLQIALKAKPQMSLTPNPYKRESTWFFRRQGNTEQLKPLHLISIIAGSVPVLIGTTTAQTPTAGEILELLCKVVLRGEGMANPQPGHRPLSIGTDEISIVPKLRALLKPADISVIYLPPPTAEDDVVDELIVPVMMKGHCISCGIPAAVLKKKLGTDLLRCGRCGEVEYCSRECQEIHRARYPEGCGKMFIVKLQ